MKKQIFGKKLQRDTNERKGLFKSLISSLILDESIKTTKAKAQAVRSSIEKLVTKVKKAEAKKVQFFQGSLSNEVFQKLKNDISLRFKTRNGGYTRIIKIGARLKDNAQMVILEWVEKSLLKKEKKTEVLEPEKLALESKVKTVVKIPKKIKEK